MPIPHVTVCVCTFKRPGRLPALLAALAGQRTDDRFTVSIVVVDNDGLRSAADPVAAFRSTPGACEVTYDAEPVQNIALARNRAVDAARGEYVAFIDDDELPGNDWLLTLLATLERLQPDGVLGPVLPRYEIAPPQWILAGRFHERPSHATGEVLGWLRTRTGNALLKRAMFDIPGNRFDPQFGSGGEDRDLFRRLIEQGRTFVWCAEAPVYEFVPPERCKRMFMLRRALLRGKTPYNHNPVSYLKSAVAIPVYALMLPFLLPFGHHHFMKRLVSLFDHVGRLLWLFRADVVKEKYVIE